MENLVSFIIPRHNLESQNREQLISSSFFSVTLDVDDSNINLLRVYLMSSNRQDGSFPINACNGDVPQRIHKFHRAFPWSNSDQNITKGWAESLFNPAIEIQETRDSFYVLLEIPGLDCQEISIQMVHDSLSIQGYRKPKFHIPARAVLDSEFHYGAFERTILIPDLVKKDQVVAEYVNGVLTISLMKANH